MADKKRAPAADAPRLIQYKNRKIELLDDAEPVHVKIEEDV